MPLMHQLSQSAFRSILTRHGSLTTRHDTDTIYVGLGDQFDDDRRLVREATATSLPMRRTGRDSKVEPHRGAARRFR